MMTDAEMYDRDPPWVLQKVAATTSPRRVRLFMSGSIRATGSAPKTRVQLSALDLIEEFADGRGTKSALNKARSALRGKKPVYPDGWGGTDYLLWCALNTGAVEGLSRFQAAWAWAVERDGLLPEDFHQRDAHTDLIREVFGNPYRPVPFSPSWRTETALSLALGMYDSRDFSAMPILADALQEAGCEDATVLAHCRGPSPHVRGCWVVDLVLGRD
jgi:hypothetical protein